MLQKVQEAGLESEMLFSQYVHFPKVQELFDEEGRLLGRSQHSQAKRLLEEQIWYARALKAEREFSGERI